ncbi:hypothetical protein IIZ77_00240 [Candidatus Saccharibacteria bacterium]|nr:hypothetical protein [Candidatus Saccharibacteria bacterium]
MATKKSTKKTTTKAQAAKAPARNRGMSVKECVVASQILKMHMTVITVLSCVVCALVVALVLALKN